MHSIPGVNQTLHNSKLLFSLSAFCFNCKFSRDLGILFDMTITPRPSCVNGGVSMSSRNGTSVSCRSSDNATSNQISLSLLRSDVESDRRASLFFLFLKKWCNFRCCTGLSYIIHKNSWNPPHTSSLMDENYCLSNFYTAFFFKKIKSHKWFCFFLMTMLSTTFWPCSSYLLAGDG